MTLMTRWNPFRELEDLQGRISGLLGQRPLRGDAGKQETLTTAEWAPLVDIVEDEKEYLIKADLPEVKAQDVKVSVQDNVLSVTGERSFEKEEKNKRYHRIERAYGSFARAFTLPEDADPQKVSAEFKEGLLKVHLPKSPSAKPRSIDVKVV